MARLTIVGSSGQITLGKEYAGCQIIVDKLESGVWLIKTGSFIPDNERWLHAKEVSEKLAQAAEWAENNPPKDCDVDTLENLING